MSAKLIAVIGAGVAGLACAQRLRQAGRHVVVFDKGRRPGGRVSTRRAGCVQFDHGAQFFTARDPRFEAQTRRWEADGVVAKWAGPFATLTAGVRGDDPRPRAVRYVGVPGMSGVARALGGGVEVRSGARVERVLRDDAGYLLTQRVSGADNATREGPFDEVVVALPPSQAVDLLRDVGGAAYAEAARLSRALLPSLCAMVAFEEPLAGAAGGMFVVGDEALGWAAHDGGKPGRGGAPTYVLHGTAAWSMANFQAPPETFAAELVQAFGRALGRRERELPAPIYLAGHRWGFALADGDPPPAKFVAEPSGVSLCGDALGGGRVEGAYVSGLELGDALLSR
ncbi:MAG: FAD-dependent oxidoreductase [Planctomycetota bacterium]|nr:FAD-dependent oxidoreductase [Planctomycetota bacterium]